jgi:hypothetical protein
MLYSNNTIGLKNRDGANSLFPIESVLKFSFDPSVKELPSSIDFIKKSLFSLIKNEESTIIIETSSPMIVILIPLLRPLRDRVEVRILFKNQNNQAPGVAITTNTKCEIAQTKRFKELLETAESLIAHGISVSFSRHHTETEI